VECHIPRIAEGEDMMFRAGPYQTIIVLADDEAEARALINRENMGFRVDRIEAVRTISNWQQGRR
jgi:hypothetical protein